MTASVLQEHIWILRRVNDGETVICLIFEDGDNCDEWRTVTCVWSRTEELVDRSDPAALRMNQFCFPFLKEPCGKLNPAELTVIRHIHSCTVEYSLAEICKITLRPSSQICIPLETKKYVFSILMH